MRLLDSNERLGDGGSVDTVSFSFLFGGCSTSAFFALTHDQEEENNVICKSCMIVFKRCCVVLIKKKNL